MNNKINLPVTFKQYNLDTNKMSTSILKKEVENPVQNLTIKDLLRNLSLPQTKVNQAIISELLNHDLPLNQELVSDLNDFISNLENADNLETKIKVALLLKKVNIPLKQKFYNFFKNYIFSQGDLKDNIEQLIKQLDTPLQDNNIFNEENQLQSTQKNEFSEAQKSFIENKSLSNIIESNSEINLSKDNLNISKSELNMILNELNLESTTENKEIIKKLLAFNLDINESNFQKIKSAPNQNKQNLLNLLFSQKLNLDNKNLLNQLNFKATDNLEHSLIKLSKLLINQSLDAPQLNTKIKELLTKEPQLLLKLKDNLSVTAFKDLTTQLELNKTEQQQILKQGLKNEIFDTIITVNNSDPTSIKNSITKLNLNEDNQLVKFLFQLSQETSSQKLQEQTEDLSKQLLNLKAVNYEVENTLLFLPILFQENLELAQIKFGQNQKKTTAKEESFNFAFKVHAEKLGPLEVKVKIKDKQLNILFLAEESASKELIDEHLQLLENAFQQHKYKLNYLECKLQEQNSKNKDENKTSLTTIDYTI